MRSPFAYTPRPRVLQQAGAGAAIAFLVSFALVAFLYSSPLVIAAAGAGAAIAGLLSGARRAVLAALRLGALLALLITVVNGLVTDRGETVLARLGEFPVLGEVNVTLEALAAGAVIGLRAMAAIVAASVYSACVDPDKVLRLLRPLAGRSALTATLISRLVPLAAADHGRLREAAALRGPAAAPVGRGALARRLLAGSLDRSVDVAATLELRGYGLDPPPNPGRTRNKHVIEPVYGSRSRFDRRLCAAGALIAAAAIAAKVAGADGFQAYPEIEVALGAEALALATLLVLAGFTPLRRRGSRA
jgi:energy-coupling factor transport system permease protein